MKKGAIFKQEYTIRKHKKNNHKKYYYQGNIDEQVKCTLCVNYTVLVLFLH